MCLIRRQGGSGRRKEIKAGGASSRLNQQNSAGNRAERRARNKNADQVVGTNPQSIARRDARARCRAYRSNCRRARNPQEHARHRH
jgi:hypothetical protein